MDAPSRYTPGLRRLHWLMAALVALVYLVIEQRGLFPRGSGGRVFMMQSHFWMGLSVLALVVWRIALRRKHGAPPITPALPRWQAVPAALLHIALYAFLVGMPLLGLATAWTDGKEVLIPFTHVAVPPLLGENEALAHDLEEWHEEIGHLFYWVIGLHIVAGFYHHFIRRDDTLRRMT